MERWAGKVAVVTGASSGIGRSIAEKLAKSGVVTVALARRLHRLEELRDSLGDHKNYLHPKECDITNEELLKKTFSDVKHELGPINILVNNAGRVMPGFICEQSTESLRALLELNNVALCIATREAVSMMRASNIAGHIVLINSVAGHYVPIFETPGAGIYPASKHAVTAIAESLRQEMNYLKTGIKITSISPGYTTTEIFDDKDSKFPAALEAGDVADAVMYVLGTPPKVQVHELMIRAVGEKF